MRTTETGCFVSPCLIGTTSTSDQLQGRMSGVSTMAQLSVHVQWLLVTSTVFFPPFACPLLAHFRPYSHSMIYSSPLGITFTQRLGRVCGEEVDRLTILNIPCVLDFSIGVSHMTIFPTNGCYAMWASFLLPPYLMVLIPHEAPIGYIRRNSKTISIFCSSQCKRRYLQGFGVQWLVWNRSFDSNGREGLGVYGLFSHPSRAKSWHS